MTVENQIQEPDLDNRELRGQSEKCELFPLDGEYQGTFQLDNVRLVNGRNGPFYKAICTVISCSDPRLMAGSQRAKIFKFTPGAVSGSDAQIATNAAMAEMVSLLAAANGQRPTATDFQPSVVKAKFIEASNKVPSLGLAFGMQQYPYVPRQGRHIGETRYKCSYSVVAD